MANLNTPLPGFVIYLIKQIIFIFKTNCIRTQFSCVFQSFILKVRVFVSLNHEDSPIVHSPSAYWTTEINTSGFQLCQRATGSTNRAGTINWVAFQDKPGISHGSLTFSGIWTTETKCHKVTFSQVRQLNELLIVPVKLVTA